MSTIPRLKFVDVGILDTVRDSYNSAETVSQIPFGIKTPLELSSDSNLFITNNTLRTQIADNLKNLISTNYGERLGIVDFGANIMPLAAEFTSKENFDNEAMARIKTASKKWMPYVELIAYESTPNYEQNVYIGQIDLIIVYSIPNANISEDMIEVKIKVM